MFKAEQVRSMSDVPELATPIEADQKYAMLALQVIDGLLVDSPDDIEFVD
jgi:hypothetical protein